MVTDNRKTREFKRDLKRLGIRKGRMAISFYKIEILCEEEEPFWMLSHPRGHMIATSEPFSYFPRFVNEEKQILECIVELKNSFETLEDRQILYVRLKHLLMQLRKKVDLTTKEFLRTINMCIDAINNVKSEQLNKEQIEALEFVLQEMREKMSEWQTNEFQKILFNVGLKPTADLEGISELYT